MIVTYDKNARSGYIRLNLDLKIQKIEKLSAYMNCDLDKSGKIVGVELLGVEEKDVYNIKNQLEKQLSL